LGIALCLELVNCAAALDSDWSNGCEDKIFLELDQCAKLRLCIGYIELTIFQDDFSMLSGNGDVGDADLTLMATADLDGSVFLSGNEVQTAFLLIFLPVA
jgi:hypothetical protein